MKLMTLLVFSLATGCVQTVTGRDLEVRVHLTMDARYYLEQHGLIGTVENATHVWDEVGSRFRLEGKDDGGEVELAIGGNPDTEHAEGSYDERGHITVETWVALGDRLEFRNVMVHELGHAMGLRHVPARGAIMNAIGMQGASGLTSEDIEEFHRVWK